MQIADNNRKLHENTMISLIYYFLLSALFLIVSTKSSPLYPLNDWVDSNAFFTMGKGMMNGKVLYLDLFEQKGPLLYFIHGISYFISNTTFLGVYIFELLSFFVFMIYCHKIISLYLKAQYALVSMPLIAFIVLNIQNFAQGDSAEEFCLPLLSISLFYFINYFKNVYPNSIPYKWLLINGMIAGAVLWIKYSMIGFWFGWMLMMGICMIVNKQYLRMIKSSLIFLGGMLIVTLPWLIYFGIHNAVFEWLNTYIFINVKYYSANLTLAERFLFVSRKIIHEVVWSPLVGTPCVVAAFFVISNKYLKSFMAQISIVVCVMMLALTVYGGGVGFIYYFLIFAPFSVLGLIVLLDLLSLKFDKLFSYQSSIIIMALLFIVTLFINHNTNDLLTNKNDLVQYKFASIINQSKNQTLLNYNNLDIGLYTVSGLTPSVKFFERQNIEYSKFPLNMDEQNRYIENQEVDYIVSTGKLDELLENVPTFYDKYELVSEQTQKYDDGTEIPFMLFKKKNI
jgi:hypothetical protein